MPACTSVGAKIATDTNRRGATICCLRAALLLVVVELISGAAYALRMINLDAPERVFLSDTIRLSCYYALQTVSSFEQATQQLEARRPSYSSAVLVDGGGGSGEQKSNSSIQWSEHEMVFESVAKSVAELGSLTSTDKAFRRSTSGVQLSEGKQVPGRSEPLVAASEQLYAVKWYKDGREFFRYLAQGSPKKQWLPMDGVLVDVDRSDNQTVFLRNVSLRTSGQFRCDVSTDAPYFMTKSIERKLLVYTQPGDGPKISLGPSTTLKIINRAPSSLMLEYFLGDRLDLVCSVPESKPVTVVDWIINDSLNLSAASSAISTIDGFEQWPVLEVTNRRLIQLSTPINGSISERGLTQVHQLPGQAPNPLTYELILNNTKAVLYHTQSPQQQWPAPSIHLPPPPQPPQPIGLAESVLDQLLELSSSRLNFTIDTNLLQTLGYQTGSKNRQKPERLLANSMLRLREIKTRLISSRGTTDTVGEERFISVGDGGDTTIVGQTRGDLTSLSEPKRTSIRMFVNKSYPSKSNSSHRAGWIKSPSSSTRAGILMNDKLLLKIECVSRFLHWSLSDTIKILINNKKRTDGTDDLNSVTAQRRLKPNGRSSADSIHFSMRDTLVMFKIILIFIGNGFALVFKHSVVSHFSYFSKF